jgi:hypothetical protein
MINTSQLFPNDVVFGTDMFPLSSILKVAFDLWNRLPRLACRAKRRSELDPVQVVLRTEQEVLEIGRS